MTPSDELGHRMSAIEKEVKYWRAAGIVTVVCVVLGITMGSYGNEEAPGTVRAKEFVLVDDEGTVRAKFKPVGETTKFWMRNGEGESELSLVAQDSRAYIGLYSSDRVNSAHIEADLNGGAIELSRDTSDVKVSTRMEGGAGGNFVKFQPLKGDAVRVPVE